MSVENKNQLASENTSLNFSKGWGIIIYCMIMFFFLIGFSIDGLNIVAPAFAKKSGIEYADVLGLSTYAGLIGLFAYVIVGKINDSIGSRITSGICMIGAGASYIFWGHAENILQYGIGLTLVTSFINGAAYIAGGSLVTQWFPKKKGLVNGITTMGHNMGSAFYVPLISFLIGVYGMAKGMTCTGVIAIIVGILGILFVRNLPQERGLYPDNVTKEVYEKEYFQSSDEEECSTWTIVKLLKTKELWLVAIVIGVNQLVTTGVMSQMVVRNIGLGFAPAKAVGLMTVCACVGVCGSYLFGWIDQKLGVKKAVLLFLVWYCIALFINITDTTIGVYISVAMIGVAIGASANFMISLPASVFGRHGFSKVYAVYFPIMNAILMSNYVINAQAIRVTGSLRGAYMVFIGLLIVNIILISLIDTRKYNKDYMKEDEILNK
ncbi:MFS transporter [Aminipila luticellarii]|uniref:MFS transporter n=1 Tax=Aminipila luticellarii TaxID=2507160 RepID=A0A410PSB0_9FIRM|nr:MFS transporter [Aminipila luticellarii]QAT41748.1 MFS transporter [Aminipila luticellarii]